MEYEYRYTVISHYTNFQVEELLNRYGKQGWRVVRMTDSVVWLERIKKPYWIER